MYFVVKIKSSQPESKFIIPVQWILGINIARVLNYGINKRKTYLMFYSLNEKKTPDFSLEIRSQQSNDDFCFYGCVIEGYGKI